MSRWLFKKDKVETGADNASWMLTFADLLSLMLTFFVLLFSMNAVQIKDWESLVQTMNRQFNPDRPKIVENQTRPAEGQQTFKPVGLNLAYLASTIENLIEADPGLVTLKVTLLEDRVVISIPASMAFPKKKPGLKPPVRRALAQLSANLAHMQNKMIVSAHTDPGPVRQGPTKTNWGLSLWRAQEIAALLKQTGYVGEPTVIAHADMRFGELDDSLELQKKYELAERVDIIIMDIKRERGPFDVF